MATESPIRLSEGSDTWRTLKQPTRYRPSSSDVAIEGLGLFLRDQQCQTLKKDVIPSRSESAPPSMEGSLAATENIFSDRKISRTNHESKVKFHGDGSLALPRNSLPVYEEEEEEESEDDRLSEQSPHVSVEKSVSEARAHILHNNSVSVSSSGTSARCSVDGDVDSAPNHDSRNLSVFSNNSNVLLQQAAPQEFLPSRIQDSYARIIYPGASHAYGYSNEFHYMTSPPGPFYYNNLPPAGFLPLQYGASGYNLNPAVSPSYLPEYPHQGGPIPMAFNSPSFQYPDFSNGYDPQNLPVFYGRVGFPLQYLQPDLRDSNEFEKRGEFAGLSNDYNSNLRRGQISGHYYFGSPTNFGPRMVSPSVQSEPSSAYNISISHGNESTNVQIRSWKDANLISFLEELKSGKGHRLELCDISGYIVEFSVDQHGSRFIQQKLQTCSVEGKAAVFEEVVPHVLKLVTDVFGNYVVQKLFEHGNPEQRISLADQLKGHILPLSLQMYGCRVIQKALDVIDLEQKTSLIRELDGHVLRCVRDQNGNHVIQKCIESIPTENIDFIISSFFGQVATLSMHPYGCRVIQRFLEHCNDNIHTQFIVDEILDSVCSLVQDRYGNYVTQHVLERGKPDERSRVIEKLAGSVVQLSQNKFASNVIEKCLEYSDSAARDMLIKEIIGDGAENDNLLVMMKDQYANYVIQRILQKCSSDHRKVLLGQIKNHLTALKKYTYGKHIVARFEKLYGDGS